MSPEQLRSLRSVEARTDIWALGVILFEMLAGSPSFAGESLPDLSVSIIVGKAPLLRMKHPDAPAKLEAANARCLEKDQTKRIAGIGELATLLAPFGSSEAEASRDNILKTISRPSASLLASANTAVQSGSHAMVHAATEVAETDVAWTDPGLTSTRRRPYVAFLVGGVVALAVAGTLAIASRAGRANHPTLVAAPPGPSTAPSVAAQPAAPIANPTAEPSPAPLLTLTPTRAAPSSSTTFAKPAVSQRAASVKPPAAPVEHPPPPVVVPIAPPPSAAPPSSTPTGVTHDRHG